MREGMPLIWCWKVDFVKHTNVHPDHPDPQPYPDQKRVPNIIKLFNLNRIWSQFCALAMFLVGFYI